MSSLLLGGGLQEAESVLEACRYWLGVTDVAFLKT